MENRFEVLFQKVKRNKLLSVLLVILFFALFESLAGWSFVAKRLATNQPVIDLIEKYYVLRPFRFLFPISTRFQKNGHLSFVANSKLLVLGDTYTQLTPS